MSIDEYRTEVSRLLERDYCLTWADACGDDEPLMRARDDGESPEEFVAWLGRKYDLDRAEDLRTAILFGSDQSKRQ